MHYHSSLKQTTVRVRCKVKTDSVDDIRFTCVQDQSGTGHFDEVIWQIKSLLIINIYDICQVRI